ncbi:hypothetical protein [Nocardia wallacei]|uniref:hypothetical protein n=1 Tax=Nocardia wallacei TaxID=480035 RepID=UPI0024545BE8|nr:hypothetical protein [Nocardia wallacei]
MRDKLGNHVTAVDKHGYGAVSKEFSVSLSVHGSFAVQYYAHIDRVCVDVLTNGSTYAGMDMQLPVEQAIVLRDLLTAGIADALAATAVEPSAEGGAA